jgi:hypothetical protein
MWYTKNLIKTAQQNLTINDVSAELRKHFPNLTGVVTGDNNNYSILLSDGKTLEGTLPELIKQGQNKDTANKYKFAIDLLNSDINNFNTKYNADFPTFRYQADGYIVPLKPFPGDGPNASYTLELAREKLNKLKSEKTSSAINPASQQTLTTNNVTDLSSPQNPAKNNTKINPMLVSPYGNQKMPGYAQIGTEKPIEKNTEEKQSVDDRTKNAITDNANEKIKNYAFNYQIPGTGIYLAHTFEHLNTWLQANQLSGLAETLIDPMRKIPGYSLDTEIEIKPDGANFTYGKNSVNEPTLKLAIDNEMKQFYEKFFSLINKYEPKTDDINFFTLVKLVDARLTTLEIQDSLIPNYKRTAIPIQVESARTTYNDRIPVDIYLDGKLFRKGYPNNTYITLDPKINLLPKGSHKLLAVDSRPGMPQNIPQSKTQEIEFRVEPNEEVIIFNVIPNRVIR